MRPSVIGKPKLTPALAENLRRRRKGKVGRSWYVDETYIRVRGQWRYLYRAMDRDGALVDVILSEHRDLAAAKAFFRPAKTVTGVTPERVTTDGDDAYPRAIRNELGRQVRHRTSRYLNNRLERDHRGIKGRTAIDAAMVPLKPVIEVATRPVAYLPAEFIADRSGIRIIAICRDPLRRHASHGLGGSKERLGSGQVTVLAQYD